MAEAYNDHMKTTPGDPCAALLDAGFNAVYDSDCYHLALHMYTENNWANDFDRLFRSNPIYMTHGVRYVENHDETRVCSPLSWGGVGRVVLPAVMTLVYASGSGPVLVYNGQEVGNGRRGPAVSADMTDVPVFLTIPASPGSSPGWRMAGLTLPCCRKSPQN